MLTVHQAAVAPEAACPDRFPRGGSTSISPPFIIEASPGRTLHLPAHSLSVLSVTCHETGPGLPLQVLLSPWQAPLLCDYLKLGGGAPPFMEVAASGVPILSAGAAGWLENRVSLSPCSQLFGFFDSMLLVSNS